MGCDGRHGGRVRVRQAVVDRRVPWRWLPWAVGVLLALVWMGVAGAAVPAKVTYQGFLKQNGVPVSASVNITVRVYDGPSAGSLNMTCSGTNIPVSSGRFFFEVGETGAPYNCGSDLSGINLAIPRYLELEVAGTTLSPREQLLAAPLALGMEAFKVEYSPSGTISATDVQAAIGELDSEKLPLTGGLLSGILSVSAATNTSDGALNAEQNSGGPIALFKRLGANVMAVSNSGAVSISNVVPGVPALTVAAPPGQNAALLFLGVNGTARFVVDQNGAVQQRGCKPGMTLVGDFCIDNSAQTGGVVNTQFAACRTVGKHLCSAQEWYDACFADAITPGASTDHYVSNMTAGGTPFLLVNSSNATCSSGAITFTADNGSTSAPAYCCWKP